MCSAPASAPTAFLPRVVAAFASPDPGGPFPLPGSGMPKTSRPVTTLRVSSTGVLSGGARRAAGGLAIRALMSSRSRRTARGGCLGRGNLAEAPRLDPGQVPHAGNAADHDGREVPQRARRRIRRVGNQHEAPAAGHRARNQRPSRRPREGRRPRRRSGRGGPLDLHSHVGAAPSWSSRRWRGQKISPPLARIATWQRGQGNRAAYSSSWVVWGS